MMTEQYVRHHILPTAYALLPAEMRSDEATQLLLAIGLHESKFENRRQFKKGPARGYWQFERSGVFGVLDHRHTRIHIQNVLTILNYPGTTEACHIAVEHNDVLAACFARLYLWTHPRALPALDDMDESWQQYVETWRPGHKRPEDWPEDFVNAQMLMQQPIT